MKNWLAILTTLVVVVLDDIILNIARLALLLLSIAVAFAVVWALNRRLGAPWYLMFVAVPLAIIAAWPLAKLGSRLEE